MDPVVSKRYENWSDGDVIIENDIYDEEPYSSLISQDASVLSDSLSAYSTYLYKNDLKNAFGKFGSSGLAQEIFQESESEWIWLASRSIHISETLVTFGIRQMANFLNTTEMYSNTGNNTYSMPFRVVIEIPGEHVSVNEKGNITLVK